MECLLCDLWARMPYALRPTTPTTAQETEGALIVGYWVASRTTTVPRICERHMHILQVIDRQEERRIEIEKVAQEESKRLEAYHQQTAHLHERQQSIFQTVKEEIIPSFVPSVTPITIPVPQATKEFQLGPGPLANENIITNQPPLPVQTNLAEPYGSSTPSTGISQGHIPQSHRTKAKAGTMEAALEVATMPATEGGKVSYPCPSCGKEVVTGDVHAC